MEEKQLRVIDWLYLQHKQHPVYWGNDYVNPCPLHYWSQQSFIDYHTPKYGKHINFNSHVDHQFCYSYN